MTNQILRRLWIAIIITGLISVCEHVSAQQVIVKVGEFSNGKLENWHRKKFSGLTQYRIIQSEGTKVLRAISENSASGLYRDMPIDLNKTPFLNWSWRVDYPLKGLDERSKKGDDYAARIYVIISGGIAFWRTKALNYVWSGHEIKDNSWPNAFAGSNAMMLAIRSPQDPIGEWFQEKRNVKSDFKKLFGENIQRIDAIAIMTDTDNSGTRAIAYYGDIYFSAD